LDYSKNYFLSSTQQRASYEEELKKFSSTRKGSIPKVFSTVGHLSKILCLIKENKGKEIGIITRTNQQIIEISRHLDINNIEYTATSSLATSLDARKSTITFIKALISNDSADKVAATFTAFSPYSLKEAFDFSTALMKKDHKQIAKINLGTADLSRDSIDRLFLEKIYPLCVSKGSEWFTTAVSIRSQIDEYLTVSNPTLDALLDFLAIGEEVQVERSKKAEITLSTVHKAKGREFDIVIALPSSSTHPYSYIDTIVTSIFKSKGIDLQDEIVEESIRVNFVAFTRAKKELNIIIGLNNIPDFHWNDKLSDLKVDDVTDKNISSVLDYHLTEAYSLFLGGKFTEAEKILKGEDPWLMERITAYFNNVDHFSWSSVTTKTDELLMKNILGVNAYSRKFGMGSSDGTKFGLEVHHAFEKILNNNAKPEDYSDDVKKALKNGLAVLKDLEKEYPGLKLVDTEVEIELPLKSLVKYKHDDLMFKGKIDALYKHDSGYLEVDWKSSTKDKDDDVTVNKRQLSVYKRMYSIDKKIPEDKIKTCLVYVALRGNIRTGIFGWSKYIGARDAQVFKTFEKHLQKVLEWRKDPKKFIKEFIGVEVQQPLILILKHKLKKELRHRKTKPKKTKPKKTKPKKTKPKKTKPKKTKPKKTKPKKPKSKKS
jgi:DNA helicase-2/ATP-dependent DNA helicase PcrA